MTVTPNLCRAHNHQGFDKHGRLKKGKRFAGEDRSPRAAARQCLEAMRAGRSRSAEISVIAGEHDGEAFKTVIGLAGSGTPYWKVPATDEGVASLPETIPNV